ncbi:MAG: hypothetical protein JWQ04_1835 [Pedosphaera sp.]|nr:hypothetical protein [Pedosphaera sp.]
MRAEADLGDGWPVFIGEMSFLRGFSPRRLPSPPSFSKSQASDLGIVSYCGFRSSCFHTF